MSGGHRRYSVLAEELWNLENMFETGVGWLFWV